MESELEADLLSCVFVGPHKCSVCFAIGRGRQILISVLELFLTQRGAPASAHVGLLDERH